MAKNHRSLLRLVLPTAHKILLKRITGPKLRALNGSTLVIGAGYEPYHELIPNVSKLICILIIYNKYIFFYFFFQLLELLDIKFLELFS